MFYLNVLHVQRLILDGKPSCFIVINFSTQLILHNSTNHTVCGVSGAPLL